MGFRSYCGWHFIHSSLCVDRMCPGRHFAEASVFINVASVLHVFDIGPPLDEKVRPIKLELEATDGLLSYARLFFSTDVMELTTVYLQIPRGLSMHHHTPFAWSRSVDPRKLNTVQYV